MPSSCHRVWPRNWASCRDSSGVLPVARGEAADWVNGRDMAPVGEVKFGGRTVRGPLQIQPGLANYTDRPAARLRPDAFRPGGHGRGLQRLCVAHERGAGLRGRRDHRGHRRASGSPSPTPRSTGRWRAARSFARPTSDEFKRNPAFVAAIGLEPHSPPYDPDEREAAAGREGRPRFPAAIRSM